MPADVPPTGSESGRVTLQLSDTGEALVNPSMGWAFHYYDNDPSAYGSRLAPSDTLYDFPGLAVVYLHFPWPYTVRPPGAPCLEQRTSA
jgi:hypothetical protein